MTYLFRREVPLRDLVAIQPAQARALQAPIRLAMLDLLSQRAMSVDDLATELPAHGFRKATNTLRHHLEILVSAGLVELTALEQTRGAVLKYFAASARPLHFELPESAAPDMARLSGRFAEAVARTIRQMPKAERARLTQIAQTMKQCPRCSSEHYEEYLLLTAVHRASLDYLRERGGHRAGTAGREPPARSGKRAAE